MEARLPWMASLYSAYRPAIFFVFRIALPIAEILPDFERCPVLGNSCGLPRTGTRTPFRHTISALPEKLGCFPPSNRNCSSVSPTRRHATIWEDGIPRPAPTYSRYRAAFSLGRLKLNNAPLSGSLTTPMVPPWASMNSFEMARPRPVLLFSTPPGTLK